MEIFRGRTGRVFVESSAFGKGGRGKLV